MRFAVGIHNSELVGVIANSGVSFPEIYISDVLVETRVFEVDDAPEEADAQWINDRASIVDGQVIVSGLVLKPIDIEGQEA